MLQSPESGIQDSRDSVGDITNNVRGSPIIAAKQGAENQKAWIERTNDSNGLSITVQFQGEPTKETYEYLNDFFEFKMSQLKKSPT